MKDVKELKCLGTMLCKHRWRERDKGEVYKGKEFHRNIFKGYEREECVVGGKERTKEHGKQWSTLLYISPGRSGI